LRVSEGASAVDKHEIRSLRVGYLSSDHAQFIFSDSACPRFIR